MSNAVDTLFSLKSQNLIEAKQELSGNLCNVNMLLTERIESADTLDELKNICSYMEAITYLTSKIDCEYFSQGEYGVFFEEITEVVRSYQYYKSDLNISEDEKKLLRKYRLL